MTGDDPDITERKTARKVKEAAEVAVGLTIADRLTNRAKLQIVDIPMKDETGDFNIPMHLPSWGETCELTQIETMMIDMKGRKHMATLMDNLSADPSLNYDFWLNGSIGIVDMRLLIEGLTKATQQRIKEVKSFR